MPCRPQRLGQVDAPQDRRRHGRLRQRHALPPALGDHPLPAAGARPLRLRDHRGLRRGRPWRRATIRIARAISSKPSGSPARRIPRGFPAARAAAPRLPATLAPEPDILLLDEPTNHLDIAAIEGLEETLAHRARPSSSSATTAASSRACRGRRCGSTAARTRRLDEGFADFEAWRDQVLEEEERERHKLDRKIVDGGALAALRRHARGGSATRSASRDLQALRARAEARPRRPAGWATSNLTVQEAAVSGKLVIEADGDREELSASGRSSATSRSASSAATGSASSDRTAPARRR